MARELRHLRNVGIGLCALILAACAAPSDDGDGGDGGDGAAAAEATSADGDAYLDAVTDFLSTAG